MRWEVSIIDSGCIELIKQAKPKGLCMIKFKADFTVDLIDFKQLQVGDILTVNNKKLVLDQVGKPCYEGCVLHDNNLDCPLKDGCAFGHWLQ